MKVYDSHIHIFNSMIGTGTVKHPDETDEDFKKRIASGIIHGNVKIVWDTKTLDGIEFTEKLDCNDKYPDICPFCDAPAYIGSNEIDCTNCNGKY